MSGNSFPFQTPEPYPGVPWAGQVEFTLLCDYCEQEIEEEDEAMNLLLGKIGLGKRNNTPMVVPLENNKGGEANVHFGCLAAHILQDMPWIADEIRAIQEAMHDPDEPPEDYDPNNEPPMHQEPKEKFCSACGVVFEDGSE